MSDSHDERDWIEATAHKLWQDPTIDALKTALAQAERDGMERAAGIIEKHRVVNYSVAPHHRLEPMLDGWPPDSTQRTYAAAIRAASKEDE